MLAIERRVPGHVLAGVGLGAVRGRVAVVRPLHFVRHAHRRPHACRGSARRWRSSARSRCCRASGGVTSTRSGCGGSRARSASRVGPALGGFLTQLFSWRSIFLLQAPLAALALVAVFDPRRARGRTAAAAGGAAAHRDRQRRLPRALRRAGRRAVPLGAAARRGVGMVADRGRARRHDTAGRHDRRAPAHTRLAAADRGRRRRHRARGRAVALGFLPASTAAWAAAALGGLRHRVWDCSAVCSRRRRCRANAPGTRARDGQHRGPPRGIRARTRDHRAGLVGQPEQRLRHVATRATTAEVLDSSVSLRTKVSLAFDLRDLIANAPRGEVPDPTVPFNKRGAATDEKLRETRDGVVAAIRDTLTRGFRSSFLIAALFAVVAALRGRARSHDAHRPAQQSDRS